MKNKVLHLIGFLFGRRFFYSFGIILQHISHRMMGIGNYENESVSGEEFVIKKIKKLFSKKRLIYFDIGAGDTSENTVLIQKYFSNYKGYLFEPMPKTYLRLKNLYSKNKYISTHNIALSSKRGNLFLYDYKNQNTEHASFNKESLLLNSKKINKIKVKKDTIKNIIKNKKINNLNFIKIDIEGGEYDAMLGAKEHLFNVDFIQFEFNSMHIYSKVTFKDFYDLLSEHFTIFRIYQDGLLKVDNYNPIYHEIYEFQNYLAINRKYNDKNLS